MIDDESPARWRLWFGAALAVGLGLRFASLLSLPIFNDEAIYGLWVRSIIGSRDWLISFSDGKQPLFYWLAAFATGILNDPLLGLRVVAALAGIAGIIGVYLAGCALGGRRAGLAAAWFYAVIPYLVVNDRLGLPDGLVAVIGPYILLAAVKLGRKPGRRRAAWLGTAIGLALLVKTTAILFVWVATLGVGAGLKQAGKKLTDSPVAWAAAVLCVLVPAALPTAVLTALAPSGAYIVGKSSSFLLTADELKALPFAQWSSNLGMLWRWSINYAQWPIIVLIGGALAGGSRRFKGPMLVSLAAAAGPAAFMALAARTWFSRYAVMAAPFVVLAAGLAFAAVYDEIKSSSLKRWLPALLILVVSTVALSQDILLIKAPDKFAWTTDDRWQYIDGWPSGYGLSGAIHYISTRVGEAGPGGVTLLVDQTMGFPKDGLSLAGLKVPLWLVDGGKHLPKLPADSDTHLYLVDYPRLNQPDFARRHRNWTLVATWQKPGKLSSWRIYEFRWRPKGAKVLKD